MPNKNSSNAAQDLASEQERRPDVQAIMAEIRARVRADVERNRDRQAPFQADSASFNASPRKAGELVNSEELRFLNLNHTYPLRINPESIATHRSGPIARLVVKLKRKVQAILWHQILKDYFETEKEFQANLVRYLNDVSRYVDSRDASNFWELIRKIDVDINRALERIERVADEQAAGTLAVERRMHEALGALRHGIDRLKEDSARVSTLENVTAGLESILARMKPAASENLPAPQIDYTYLLLENRFRGSEAEIASRVSIYPEIFKGAKKPILDLGAGRGELVAVFNRAGLKSYGVDLDRAMGDAARASGLDVRHENGLTHLQALPDGSLGGLIAIQVVEHLNHAQLSELIRLAVAKVEKGGRIVFETINPRSLTALSSNYFRDPTHVWPLHPDTLGYAMQLGGLKLVETRFLSPVPAEAALQPLPIENHLSPRWVSTVQGFNRNIKQLNDLLFGAQDYCVVAEVP
ncbi:MAG: class I SAM-dependent methyltransferase [Oligoflexia bacterium]|nr:class I SAM-dependent methyltransferase [Oligoflexia bacterium]